MSVETLPNSIPINRKIDWSISRGGARWIYMFCASCGCDGGRVLETDMPENFAFYLCDEKQNNCIGKYGELAGTFAVPDEAFFNLIRQEQLEKYGRLLTAEEVAIELQDDSSLMSKLKKELR